MVRHIVMFEFLEEAEGKSKRENAEIAKVKLEALVGVVPSLLSAEVNLNSKNADPNNYDLVLITKHNDMEGLHAYATHPEHLKVGKFIGTVKKSRVCVDYEY
ncbi:MAG: Dabb family protein [Velocimicrobium sp.]